MFKIVLDGGHGLYTAGKRCFKSLDKKETREWVLNDRICDKVQKKLKKYNDCSVLRVDDTTGKEDIPLTDRVNSANAFGADLYLSVHHDAGIKGGVGGGIVAIVDNDADDVEKEYQSIIYSKLIEHTGLKGNRSNPMPKQNLYVLKYSKMPAVLVECGFMDSATDVPIILTEDFAENCANAIVDAIVQIGNLNTNVELTTINDIVWELGHRGIVADKDGMIEEMNKNPNGRLYWLARKCVNYIRGIEI